MATRGSRGDRPNRLVMARSRGTVTGLLLMLLGAWGALIPFIGHSFGYGFTPDNTWTWTTARGWLEVAPGAAAFLGGALLITSSNRLSAMLGGWLAAAGGAWFVVGTVISPWWSAGNIGVPVGSADHAVWERLGMFAGLGVAIVLFAAIALGRVSVIGARDVAAGQARLDADETTDQEETTAARPAVPASATARPVVSASSGRPTEPPPATTTAGTVEQPATTTTPR